jgi:hypothetical protein
MNNIIVNLDEIPYHIVEKAIAREIMLTQQGFIKML